jgi:hypothetical protein
MVSSAAGGPHSEIEDVGSGASLRPRRHELLRLRDGVTLVRSRCGSNRRGRSLLDFVRLRNCIANIGFVG